LERAAERLSMRARLTCSDALSVPVPAADLVVGNPPWGAGRVGAVRRGSESASAFVKRALDVLTPGGRLCLLLPQAWLEVAAHRQARADLLARATLERVDSLGHVFGGVVAPAARVIARREPDPAARRAAQVLTPGGRVPQSQLLDDPDHLLLGRLDALGRAL